MAVKFQEGWQKQGKSVHEGIRERGNAARKSADLAEKAKFNTADAAKKAAGTKQAASVKKPAQPGKDIAHSNQGKRVGTQDQASRLKHAEKAADEMAKLKSDAGKLSHLSTKIATPKGTDSAATRNPVAAKNDTPQANIKKGAEQPAEPSDAGSDTVSDITADTESGQRAWNDPREVRRREREAKLQADGVIPK